MKQLTEEQAEAKRDQAVEFLYRIGQDAQAEDFDEMSAEEYAEHRGATIINPAKKRRSSPVPRTKTKAEIEQELDDANSYIEELEGKLETISGVLSDDEDDEDEDGEEADEFDEDEFSD